MSGEIWVVEIKENDGSWSLYGAYETRKDARLSVEAARDWFRNKTRIRKYVRQEPKR